MPTEIELKLSVPSRVAGCLYRHPLLAAVTAKRHQLQNIYFDTPELSFRNRGMALRLRRKGGRWLRTVKTMASGSGGLAVRGEWEIPATPGEWHFDDIPALPIRAALEEGAPRLQPVFTTHFRRTAWVLEYRDSRLEVALDRGWIVSVAGRKPISELELELLQGKVADLFDFALLLQGDLPLQPASVSKAESGYALFSGETARPCKFRLPDLEAEVSPIAVFRHIALACLEQLQRNQGLVDSGNAEYLHQVRLALRRLRAALGWFAPVLPEPFVSEWSRVWREEGGALGEARDADVLAEITLPAIASAFPGDSRIAGLQRKMRWRARRALTRLAVLLSSQTHARRQLAFAAALYSLSGKKNKKRQRLLLDRLEEQQARVLRLAENVTELDDSGCHRLRLECRKLRYGMEFCATFLPGRPPEQEARLTALAGMQSELGRLNDCVVARAFLASLPRSAVAEGWLAGRYELLRACLPDRLAFWLKDFAVRGGEFHKG